MFCKHDKPGSGTELLNTEIWNLTKRAWLLSALFCSLILKHSTTKAVKKQLNSLPTNSSVAPYMLMNNHLFLI